MLAEQKLEGELSCTGILVTRDAGDPGSNPALPVDKQRSRDHPFDVPAMPTLPDASLHHRHGDQLSGPGMNKRTHWQHSGWWPAMATGVPLCLPHWTHNRQNLDHVFSAFHILSHYIDHVLQYKDLSNLLNPKNEKMAALQ